ncbi:MAG: glycosyltransferase family 4 protein [Tissierellia bacterium]|jgi:glycosyltransferase involved in cell wall biosynthesis|nr:glycosyltransferase family 4 protein [Tissierellia bacterium]
MKKIVWITADSFIDVDLPIVEVVSKDCNITWIVILGKLTVVDYYELIERQTKLRPTYFKLKYRGRDIRLAFQYFKLLNNIRKQNPDIVYVDCVGAPYFVPMLRLFLGNSKVVFAVHNVKTPKGAHNYYFMRSYVNLAMILFRNVHVFSRSQFNYLKNRWGKKNVLEAPLALKDFGASKVKDKNKLITFLNFGIIRDYKRVDILIEAAELAYERTRTPFLVIIAGSCNNWSKYQNLIKNKFLFETRIEPIPNSDIPDLFAKSHYFVLPYQDIAQSGALTVALNYNLPVLASDLPAFLDVIENGVNGYIFEAGSVFALADLIEEIILNHENTYQVLLTNQQEYVATNYNVEQIARKYIDCFKSLV